MARSRYGHLKHFHPTAAVSAAESLVAQSAPLMTAKTNSHLRQEAGGLQVTYSSAAAHEHPLDAFDYVPLLFPPAQHRQTFKQQYRELVN